MVEGLSMNIVPERGIGVKRVNEASFLVKCQAWVPTDFAALDQLSVMCPAWWRISCECGVCRLCMESCVL